MARPLLVTILSISGATTPGVGFTSAAVIPGFSCSSAAMAARYRYGALCGSGCIDAVAAIDTTAAPRSRLRMAVSLARRSRDTAGDGMSRLTKGGALQRQ